MSGLLRRHRLVAGVLAGVIAAAGAATVVVGAGHWSTPSAVPRGGPSEKASSPPVTAVNPKTIDRQPAPGRESTILPAAVPANGGGGTTPTTGVAGGSASKPVVPTVVIPKLGVRAPVIPEGIDTTPGDAGNLAVPSDVSEVGWWDGGPTPGQAGTAVLASHRAADGVFWTLPQLTVGDRIEVTGTNGQTTDWKVSQVQQFLKADLPDSVWVEGGPPKLALVTCGGQFNYSIGHYNDNVIVWATPT